MGRGKRRDKGQPALLPLTTEVGATRVPTTLTDALVADATLLKPRPLPVGQVAKAIDLTADDPDAGLAEGAVAGVAEVMPDGTIEVRSLDEVLYGRAYLDHEGWTVISDARDGEVARVSRPDPTGKSAALSSFFHHAPKVRLLGDLVVYNDLSSCQVFDGAGLVGKVVVKDQERIDLRLAGAAAYFFLLPRLDLPSVTIR